MNKNSCASKTLYPSDEICWAWPNHVITLAEGKVIHVCLSVYIASTCLFQIKNIALMVSVLWLAFKFHSSGADMPCIYAKCHWGIF